MKIVYTLFFLYLSQYCFSQTIENDVLFSKVLKQLDIKEDECDEEFFIQHQMPGQIDTTIAILAIRNTESNEEEGYTALDAYILLLDSKTWEISHTFYKEYFWESDAVFISDVSMENNVYALSENKEAFGVRTRYRTNSQPNPYALEDLSLFIPLEEGSLSLVLDSFTILEYESEWDMNCAGKSIETRKDIIITDQLINGYYNIEVSTVIQNRRTFVEGENCEENIERHNKPIESLVYTEGKYTKQ